MDRNETFLARLMPPADKNEIRFLADQISTSLPPSYAAFLSLSDGWESFSGRAKLLSIADRESEWYRTRMNQIVDHLDEFDHPPLPAGALIVMLGTNEPDFTYIDLTSRSPDGECAVIHFDLLEGELGRYPSFRHYLDAERTTIRDIIKSTA